MNAKSAKKARKFAKQMADDPRFFLTEERAYKHLKAAWATMSDAQKLQYAKEQWVKAAHASL